MGIGWGSGTPSESAVSGKLGFPNLPVWTAVRGGVRRGEGPRERCKGSSTLSHLTTAGPGQECGKHRLAGGGAKSQCAGSSLPWGTDTPTQAGRMNLYSGLSNASRIDHREERLPLPDGPGGPRPSLPACPILAGPRPRGAQASLSIVGDACSLGSLFWRLCLWRKHTH